MPQRRIEAVLGALSLILVLAWVPAAQGTSPQPEIARAQKLQQKGQFEAAAEAWRDRMQAVRHGCRAAVQALDDDGVLSPDLSLKTATDALWALLSVRQWELLTRECGWSQKRYVELTQRMARRMLASTAAGSDL